jgi:hypothetical protein
MKIEVVKKILCLYGYEKINDNEYMFDDGFLNKISIYFKDENTMYLQRSINNMKVINLEEFDNIDILNPRTNNIPISYVYVDSNQQMDYREYIESFMDNMFHYSYKKRDSLDTVYYYDNNDVLIFTIQYLEDEIKFHYSYEILFHEVEIYRDEKVIKLNKYTEKDLVETYNTILKAYNKYIEYQNKFNEIISQ